MSNLDLAILSTAYFRDFKLFAINFGSFIIRKNKKKLFGGFVGLHRAGITLPFDKAFRDMDLSRLKEVCNDSLRAVGAD